MCADKLVMCIDVSEVWRWIHDLHEHSLLAVCKCPCKWADLLYTTWSPGTFKQVKGDFKKDTFGDNYMNTVEGNS